jgi:hypothetical protein
MPQLVKLYTVDLAPFVKTRTDALSAFEQIRSAAAPFLDEIGEATLRPCNCYRCRIAYIRNGLAELAKAGADREDIPDFLLSLVDYPILTATVARQLSRIGRSSPAFVDRVCGLLIEGLPGPPPHLIAILAGILGKPGRFLIRAVHSTVEAVSAAAEFLNSNPAIAETVIEPLLNSLNSCFGSVLSPDVFALSKAYRAWRAPQPGGQFEQLALVSPAVAQSLLIDSPSKSCRRAFAKYLQSLLDSDGLSRFVWQVLDTIENLRGEHEELFDVIGGLVAKPNPRRSSTIRNGFKKLVSLLAAESDRLLRLDRSFGFDIPPGPAMLAATKAVTACFRHQFVLRDIVFRTPDSIIELCQTYFRLKAVRLHQTESIQAAVDQIPPILRIFIAEEPAEIADAGLRNSTPARLSIFMQAFSRSVSIFPRQVVAEFAGILLPTRVPMNVPIVTRKWPTQQDVLPGLWSISSTGSHEYGPLMRHVRDKICRDARLDALQADEHGIELLVNDHLISLDCRIEDVYRRIWLPAKGQTPMVVFVRVQGLDGEATEPFVEPTEEPEVQPACDLTFTTVLAVDGGFRPFVDAFRADKDPTFVVDLVKLFGIVLRFPENCAALANLGLIDLAFETIRSLLATPDQLTLVIQLARVLLAQHPDKVRSPAAHVSLILDAIRLPAVEKSPVHAALIALLPGLVAGDDARTATVLDHFTPDLPRDFRAKNDRLAAFAEFAFAVPPGPEGNAIRDAVRARTTVVDDGIGFILAGSSIDAPGFPALLKTLAGLVTTHAPTQALFVNADLISALLDLEGAASTNSIGSAAADVLERATEPPSVCGIRIEEIRRARREDELLQAKAARDQRIAAAAAIAPNWAAALDSLDDVEGWECCICKEGYSVLPGELMSFYVFVRRAPEMLISTGFTCVHNKCHFGTWEMARLRNCELECNGLFPIPSDTVGIDDYRAELARFYATGVNPFVSCVTEMDQHLKRLGSFEPADFRRGGGSIANEVGWLPFLINAGHLVLEAPGAVVSRENREAEMQKIVNGQSEITFGFALSLWIMSLAEWNGFKLELLGRYIRRLRISTGVEDIDLFRQLRSILIQFVATQKIQEQLKKLTQRATASDSGIAKHIGDPWITDFQREINEDGMAKCAEWKELGELFERSVLTLEDIDAAFRLTDDLGTLAAYGYQSPIGWVRTFLE